MAYSNDTTASGNGVRRTARPAERSGAETAPLAAVLGVLRRDGAATRVELERRTGLSRAVVAQRVNELLERGLVDEPRRGPSTGGRAPRLVRFLGNAGHVLVADVGATSIDVALADLGCDILLHRSERADVTAGPEPVLGRIDELFDDLLARRDERVPVWGVGIGLPGPVRVGTGRPVAPPVMPGWDGYPVAPRFESRYGAPVFVDNDVNVMALGELRAGVARGHDDVVFVKVGTGIGAGIVSGGRLHRGALGAAGDVGHIRVSSCGVCRCGNVGCLEAVAGGAAIARDGTAAAREGRSPALADVLARNGRVEAADVGAAAAAGDPTSRDLIAAAGRLIGRMLENVVNTLNPSLVVIGGGVAGAGDPLLACIRGSVYGHSLPLATRDLVIARSALGSCAGVTGAAAMVADELLSSTRLARRAAAAPPPRPAVASAAR